MPPLTRSMKTKQQQQQQQKQSRKRKASIEPHYPKGFDVDAIPDNWKWAGQIYPADNNTLSVELAQFAIEDNNNKKGSKEQLEYIEILKAMVASCSGRKFWLAFNVKKIDDGCVKTCQAIVLRWWHGLREVISFGDIQASSVGSNSKTLASVPEEEAGPISQDGSNTSSELIISRYDNKKLKRKHAGLAAPTDDKEVQALLQRLSQPISLSTNETHLQRRDRLRVVMGILSYQGQFERLLKAHEEPKGTTLSPENDSIVRVGDFNQKE